MKKRLSLIFLLVLSLVIFTACGSSSSSDGDTTTDKAGTIEGEWVYQGPNDADPKYEVNLDISVDNVFELEVTDQTLTEDSPANTDSIISGSYETTDTTLTLTPDNVMNNGGLINDAVKVGTPITLEYELSADSESLKIVDLQNAVKDAPDSAEFARGQQNE